MEPPAQPRAIGNNPQAAFLAGITVLQAENMPEYGRNIVYGITILAILLLYGRGQQQR